MLALKEDYRGHMVHTLWIHSKVGPACLSACPLFAVSPVHKNLFQLFLILTLEPP